MTADLTYAQGLDGPVLADLSGEPLGWIDFASCTEVDPALFFPPLGLSTAKAKEICAGCPVTEDCLDYQLAYERVTPRVDHLHGVFGGKSAKEREAILAAENRAAGRVFPGRQAVAA